MATEMDEPMVELGDPVVFAVLKDRERETDRALGMVTIKGALGVGVGEIVGLQNRGQGRGQLSYCGRGCFRRRRRWYRCGRLRWWPPWQRREGRR